MDFEGVITLLKSIKEFRVNNELPFNTIDYMTIDNAIEFLAAHVNTDEPLVYRNSAGVVFCKVCGTGLDVV